jgi:hypothetical protein
MSLVLLRGEMHKNLWLRDLETGAERQLTHSLGWGDYFGVDFVAPWHDNSEVRRSCGPSTRALGMLSALLLQPVGIGRLRVICKVLLPRFGTVVKERY